MNEPVQDSGLRRAIRSFVLRQGRMTAAQQRAFDHLLPKYGVPRSPVDLGALFGREAPRVLEIGFGNGDNLLELARQHPEQDFLGIEVHRPGVGRLLMALESEAVPNVRVICDDAVTVLRERFPAGSLDAVLLYFPDPWPKKRHHKRRLVQAEFAGLVARCLKPGGHFRLATDWEDYARQMLAVLSTHVEFRNAAPEGGFIPRPAERPLTRFEHRGLRLGHAVRDLHFIRR